MVRGIIIRSVLIVLAVAGYLYLRRDTNDPNPRPIPPPAVAAATALEVHNFCGKGCHSYPPPDSFPKKHWRMEVHRGFAFFDKSTLTVTPPPIEGVIKYYEEHAPEEYPEIKLTPPSRPLDVRFDRVSYAAPSITEHFAISHVNLVRLPPPGKIPKATDPLDILACDMKAGVVMLLRLSDPKPTWTVLAKVANPAHAEVIDLDGDGIKDVLVANLGSYPPTDLRCGSVVWLRGKGDGSFTPVTLMDQLGRVADVQAADFRGTGKLDLVVASFGWQHSGALLLLENHTTDWENPKFVSRVIDERHGTIHVPVTDLNGDNKPDFIALIAQEHESVVAFVNDGKGKFTSKTLYTAPHPGYGSSGIELKDLNGDGKLDVLLSNGDILDDPFLFKPYHSIQWLENKGDLTFEHHPVTPMYGVHRAVAGRVTGGKHEDIVGVSFLPADKFAERGKRKADAIVLLQQIAPGSFDRHSLATVDCDHVSCAVGDVFGTGRLDIVVGNFSSQTTKDPVTIWKNLGKK